MRFFSWNVNGIRAATRKGFLSWLEAENPDVLCLQETRANTDQIGPDILSDHGYHVTWVSAQKKGYSGVATFSREKPDEVVIGLGEERFDSEGRMVMTRHGDIVLFNGYFPNGGRTHARVPYKLDFYKKLLAQTQPMVERGEKVIICGDWNTAHKAVDLARPKANVKTSGFTPIEREAFDEFFEAGFIDAFRQRYPDTNDVYTWWSNRAGVRQRNIGWRIDYHMVSPKMMEDVVDVRIHTEVLGSDHCPIELAVEA
jgi:exodeoxyribonuclease-3